MTDKQNENEYSDSSTASPSSSSSSSSAMMTHVVSSVSIPSLAFSNMPLTASQQCTNTDQKAFLFNLFWKVGDNEPCNNHREDKIRLDLSELSDPVIKENPIRRRHRPKNLKIVHDDADAAAGTSHSYNDNNDDHRPLTKNRHHPKKDPTVLLLGFDISHHTPQHQFMISAFGVFAFTLGYGFLQELLAVHLCNRQLGLFLAVAQFTGYSFWSYVFKIYVQKKKNPSDSLMGNVPFKIYIWIALVRALDLGMTNMAMQYINYPAKTLMKSSRVLWTMLFGALIAKKRYKRHDYYVVAMMVLGLVIFMHADSKSDAVFQPMGVIMLTISLICDGAVTNMSEIIMNKYDVGQDEFIFSLYSLALGAITVAAALKGDLVKGIEFLLTPGTLDQINHGLDPTWSVEGKISVVILFSTLGFFGSSCAAAITKHFGALTMSITSTARKATTLFLSYMLFPNVCSVGHITGISLFVSSLLLKTLRSSHRHERHHHKRKGKEESNRKNGDILYVV